MDHANAHVPRDDRPWTAADTLKNVLVMVRTVDGSREPLAIAVPGDREVDLKRLAAQLEPDEVEPFTEEDFADHPSLAKGYIGPGVLGADNASGIRYLADPRVVIGTRWVTGADTPGQHVFDLVCGRDFTPDGVLDVAEIKEGDPAPDGSGPLRLARGIEMGHIFQLGRKYAEALGLKVLDSNGKLVTVTMGSYGVGVSRAVAAVAEGTSDEKGLCWPRELAPFDVQVLATGKGEAVLAGGHRPGPRARRRRGLGAAGRPQGQSRGEVRGLRDPGHAHLGGGRPRSGRRGGRAARPGAAVPARTSTSTTPSPGSSPSCTAAPPSTDPALD